MPATAVAVDGERKQRRTKRPGKGKKGYLFNHSALATVFRAKVLTGLKDAGLTLPGRYPATGGSDCKGIGTGEKALVYLVGSHNETQG